MTPREVALVHSHNFVKSGAVTIFYSFGRGDVLDNSGNNYAGAASGPKYINDASGGGFLGRKFSFPLSHLHHRFVTL